MWILAPNLGEILREFGEILGKYRILDDSSLGSKGLKKNQNMKQNIFLYMFTIIDEI